MNDKNQNHECINDIGGYFELSLPKYSDPFPEMAKLQSARAALRLVLERHQTREIYVPAYICDSVVAAIEDAGARPIFYSLSQSLFPENIQANISESTLFLYVNYFGLCQHNVKKLLELIPGHHLIVDNSQALFAAPANCLATIYSPRKFMGLPDGGLLHHSTKNFELPAGDDTQSVVRMNHLLMRMSDTASAGYATYTASEQTLENTTPMEMSRLTKRILSSVDMNHLKQQRRKNFLHLSNQLSTYNKLEWALDENTVPLCYPLVLEGDVDPIRKLLASMHIYIPVYWREVRNRALANTTEQRFSENCLFLPCDQRYSTGQMEKLSQEVVNHLARA